MPASIAILGIGPNPYVNGNNKLIVVVGPRPGNTPINVPIKHPNKHRYRLDGVKEFSKPNSK
jgi:hypothetical protein